ncbi:MAG: type II toxin-antitoxin system MqsA family antitoxin [Deltaproteobacteria bacterium]|nr:type II toxin-antitoxin system MqsA family antitoxin [Deltaproteobacteria bacterium]
MYELKNGTLCPLCERGKLLEEKKDLVFSYKESKKCFENERAFVCDVCGYEGLSPEANKRIEKELTDFRRSVDGLLSCAELKSIREELGLNMKEMAKLLSVNEKTIGRYENGKVTQSKHMDKLYRVLRAFPSAVSALEPGIIISNYKYESGVMTREKSSYNPKLKNGYHFADDYSFESEVNVIVAGY